MYTKATLMEIAVCTVLSDHSSVLCFSWVVTQLMRYLTSITIYSSMLFII